MAIGWSWTVVCQLVANLFEKQNCPEITKNDLGEVLVEFRGCGRCHRHRRGHCRGDCQSVIIYSHLQSERGGFLGLPPSMHRVKFSKSITHFHFSGSSRICFVVTSSVQPPFAWHSLKQLLASATQLPFTCLAEVSCSGASSTKKKRRRRRLFMIFWRANLEVNWLMWKWTRTGILYPTSGCKTSKGSHQLRKMIF